MEEIKNLWLMSMCEGTSDRSIGVGDAKFVVVFTDEPAAALNLPITMNSKIAKKCICQSV